MKGLVIAAACVRGRKSVLLFLLGNSMAFRHETSSGFGDTCSRTCAQTMESISVIVIVWEKSR